MSKLKNDQRVFRGFKLPFDGPPTDNEIRWIEVLRRIFNEDVPEPDLKMANVLAALNEI